MADKPSTATAVWIATTVLHRENPTRDSFQASEIAEKASSLALIRASPATLSMHISLHCVGNSKAAPNTIRFLYRVKNGWYRLFRNGDDFHESRKYGRTFPKRESLPAEYDELLNWYENSYSEGMSLESPTSETSRLNLAILDEKNSTIIPPQIRNLLKITKGDLVAFENSNGQIILKKCKAIMEQ
jgi:hypothetical protein